MKLQARAVEYDVANRVFFRLYQASNLVHKQGTRSLGSFGATTQQWAVLGALAREQVEAAGMTVKQLLAFLEVSRQNLTPVIDRLEARGWIERVVDETDARSRRVCLTAAGRKIWRRMQSPIDAFYSSALQDLTPAEQGQLGELLGRLKTSLAAMHAGLAAHQGE
jgi:DNA-binding MarR family transcriptional regulator